ncbi:hypothetical protein ROA7450_00446 [Roseovarius albus]|uniref:DUF2852 domain-containing protein n=1 Tax=Roseovarius albus TaxID=1247867 RepID=A0A1X6YBS3_9RHOB|nr:DUF2852 domain-containing protein [Roseovarius albus]SLN16623.1 hypothetical protein ROA7450_00446 [Roseovarius albus]
MTTASHSSIAPNPVGWLAKAEHWLDNKGKPAWIIATVLAFILFWPLGLALLAYMIWGKKMFCSSTRSHGCSFSNRRSINQSSGNSAFDAYREDTLRRLEDEQKNFENFLQRLRDARDKAEFDQFMDEREKIAKNLSDEA